MGDCLKRGTLGLFTDLRGDLARKRGMMFSRGVETPMHNMWYHGLVVKTVDTKLSKFSVFDHMLVGSYVLDSLAL